jgi:hypothetical protein
VVLLTKLIFLLAPEMIFIMHSLPLNAYLRDDEENVFPELRRITCAVPTALGVSVCLLPSTG